jgi:GAF domain-containing protein
MTLRIGHLPPGEELTDAKTFFALASTIAAPLGPPADPRRQAPATVRELPEIGSRTRGRPVAPVHTPESHREEPSGALNRPPASPAAAAALEAEIDRCTSREHVARLALHLARAYVPAATLFQVHRGVIERTCSEGSAIDGEGLLFPADAPSLFAEVAASGESFRGAPPDGALEKRVLQVLAREQVREIVLLPIAIRGRVVGLLYADNGPEALADASVAALAAVCARVSRAYQRLILERKAG